MTVTVAKTAGFCYGVNRAVTLAEKTAREGTPCVMLGEIIHNEHVINHLRELGMGQITRPEDVPEGASVLIRSHGEAKEVYDRVARQGSPVIDATCPSVARIHRLVQEAEQKGRQPVIIGLPTHPEVKAIAGWCRSPVVLEDAEALEKWLAEDEKRGKLPLTFVFQTTSTRSTMKNCENLAKKQCTNAELFDTICIATAQRQSEAQELAAQSDVMIVIGDHQSANTRHLAELCRQRCSCVYWIEEADELPMDELEGASRVGITAGEYTPCWIIKEVKTKIS
ncbi:MAG: 4-hydroxy-3-methylbut-2-enyl diphosphate reductase, partial [Clostridiales bacterium]|nr:4-hydroxy-3-methylbut-2-enyl diphosphate reductase [Clostridiales bacterium]